MGIFASLWWEYFLNAVLRDEKYKLGFLTESKAYNDAYSKIGNEGFKPPALYAGKNYVENYGEFDIGGI